MFYDPQQFEFTPILEENWEAIYKEFLGIRDYLIDWIEKKLYDQGWQVYMLYSFPHGDVMLPNILRCPTTASIVKEHVPTHGVATFSILQPQTHIKPHTGYQGEVLRCHLPLSVPEGNCQLRVRDETRLWEPGKVLIFDDRVEHEAWNFTDQERVVLIIDFVPDCVPDCVPDPSKLMA